jgi:hypothetical protein
MGVYLSTDSCGSWTRTSAIVCEVGISLPNGGMLLGTADSGIAVIDHNGVCIGFFNDGLTNLKVHTLALDNNTNIYAGTDNGIWWRPLSEIITSVEPLTSELPHEFLLSQNYPNPFNPSTTIRYALSFSANVRLSIYDLLGREIETLVNKEQSAGWKEVEWNAANIPNGVYFYRLQVGDFTSVKKMVLLK